MKVTASAAAAVLTIIAAACGGTGSSDVERSAADTGTERHEAGSVPAGRNQELTGCLLAGGDAGTYVLQLGSTGEAGAAAATSGVWVPGATYRVDARNDQDLAPHLNKIVAILGSVEGGSAGSVGTSGGNAEGRLPSDGSELARVRVESVRLVADRCPAGAGLRSPKQ